MLIEFAPSIFDSLENNNKFSFLFNLFYLNRRYNFFIDITQISKSLIYSSLSSGDKEIIEEYFNRQVTEDRPINFLIREYDIDELFIMNLDEAIVFFNQPVSIVVENNQNDKHFLISLVKNFSSRGKTIRRHLENRWIDFVNGGGCDNIENVILEKLGTFSNLPRPPYYYLRFFILIDSDSQFPNDFNEKRIRLRMILEENEIPYHFLIKREMENYLPEEAFDEINDNDDYIRAYKRLTPIQKDYFDIQKGFEDKNFNTYPEDIQELYRDVSSEDIAIFRKASLKLADFKTEFPKLFLKNIVTKETLKKRVSHQEDANELESILDKINKLL